MSLLRYNLTYHHDSARLFARIVNQPWAVFLDSGQMLDAASGHPGSQYGVTIFWWQILLLHLSAMSCKLKYMNVDKHLFLLMIHLSS